jgi:hypothetical protein
MLAPRFSLNGNDKATTRTAYSSRHCHFGIRSCDPLRRISVSRPIAAPLDRTCVIETLRMEKTLKEAAVTDSGLIYAEVILPAYLSRDGYPATTGINVQERRNDKGELEINVFKNWVGSGGSREFRAYMVLTMEELRDRTIQRCGGR